MRKIVIAFLLTFLVVVIAAFSGWQVLQSYLDNPLAIDEPEIILVEQGSSFRRVGNDLTVKGLLDNPDWLAFYIRIQKVGHLLKAGEYRLQPGLTPRQLVRQLIEGKSLAYNFTVVEGATFAQLRASLAQSEKLVLKTSALTDAEIMLALGLENQHPEGLFLADTYQFHRGMSDLDLLRRANNLLQDVLQQAWQEKAQQLPYTDAYQSLIMASIVEKETALASERPAIAGVFVKRLEKGMRLQTDPTVIYGMGDAYKGNIRKADLLRKTPYNTYTINGLPPTPIAMVGREAIQAALHPETNKWLYFVAKGNGNHQFSANLKQHNRAVKEYQQRRRRTDYRSTPSQ